MMAEPGIAPDRSAAFRTALREYLNLEADRERESTRKRKS
jgi:metal-responsive CopG/Arc/MetJ family transcriptional regulator